MRLQIHHIDPLLRPYVRLICTMECIDESDTEYIRVLPDCCVELFINYTSTPIAIIENELYQHSIVTFRMTRSKDVQMRKGSGCIAICFHPGMAYPFFNIPMHLLSDTITPLANLWNYTTSDIEEKLAAAHINDERVNIVQQHLLELLKTNGANLPIIHSLEKVKLSLSLVTISELIDDIGISQRQLSRKFQQQIGLSPAAYLKVNRFINSLYQLKKYPDWSLTEIAYESGYYDQAHFVRDYKAYTGHTPGQVANSKHILY
ncbi:MAG TPA: helix-turn-helix domain-containing protein [Flavobacterium sp.]|nr:helix-turn-helix domain-containing protein [Flavobacterium sp.]